MDNDQKVIEKLIAYWQADPSVDEETRQICRELTQELARKVSAVGVLLAKEDPQRHRLEISRMLQALREPELRNATPTKIGPAIQTDPYQASRLVPASPLPTARPASAPASPSATGRIQTQTIQGDGNVSFNGEQIQGVRVQAAPQPARRQEAPTSSAPRSGSASPIRILFLGANPLDSTRLRLDEEVREIDQALITAELGGRFELCQKWAVRTGELQSHLLRYKPQIVHFSGHGSQQNAIFLETEGGTSQPIASALLARLLAQFNQRIRCVVLNACYSEEQATAIAEHIDCVIGMSTAVMDRVAIRFAASFYQAIAFGYNLRGAFDLACSDIEIGELGQEAVPQLIALRKDPEKIVLAR